jgi:hypothetical protein
MITGVVFANKEVGGKGGGGGSFGWWGVYQDLLNHGINLGLLSFFEQWDKGTSDPNFNGTINFTHTDTYHYFTYSYNPNLPDVNIVGTKHTYTITTQYSYQLSYTTNYGNINNMNSTNADANSNPLKNRTKKPLIKNPYGFENCSIWKNLHHWSDEIDNGDNGRMYGKYYDDPLSFEEAKKITEIGIEILMECLGFRFTTSSTFNTYLITNKDINEINNLPTPPEN